MNIDDALGLALRGGDADAILVDGKARAVHLANERDEGATEGDDLLQALALQQGLARLEEDLGGGVGIDDPLILGENEDRVRQGRQKEIVGDMAARARDGRLQHGRRV